MREYHKIQTMFKREQQKPNRIIEGQWSLPEFEYLANNKWVFTEKVDGTNIRVMWRPGAEAHLRLTFGGKTDNASIPAFLLLRLQELFSVEKLSAIYPVTELCLYGEGYGARIQKGGGNYKPDGADFVLFDVKIGDWWLKREDVKDIARNLVIPIVPIIGIGTLNDAIGLVRSGIKSQWGNFVAEGIVARPEVELKTRNGERIITKIKHRDFFVNKEGGKQ